MTGPFQQCPTNLNKQFWAVFKTFRQYPKNEPTKLLVRFKLILLKIYRQAHRHLKYANLKIFVENYTFIVY